VLLSAVHSDILIDPLISIQWWFILEKDSSGKCKNLPKREPQMMSPKFCWWVIWVTTSLVKIL